MVGGTWLVIFYISVIEYIIIIIISTTIIMTLFFLCFWAKKKVSNIFSLQHSEGVPIFTFSQAVPN